MTWSVNKTGPRDEVRAYAEQEFERQRLYYGDAAEAADVVAARGCVLSALDMMTKLEPDALAPRGYHASVSACGHRPYDSSGCGGCNITISVSRFPIPADATGQRGS